MPAAPTRPAPCASQALHAHPAFPQLLKALLQSKAALESQLHAQALAEVSAFTDSHDPAAISGLRTHFPQLVEHLLFVLANDSVKDLQFVAEHARERADNRFPLEAMLHAYRSAHRTALQALRASALRLRLESEACVKAV